MWVARQRYRVTENITAKRLHAAVDDVRVVWRARSNEQPIECPCCVLWHTGLKPEQYLAVRMLPKGLCKAGALGWERHCRRITGCRHRREDTNLDVRRRQNVSFHTAVVSDATTR